MATEQTTTQATDGQSTEQAPQQAAYGTSKPSVADVQKTAETRQAEAGTPDPNQEPVKGDETGENQPPQEIDDARKAINTFAESLGFDPAEFQGFSTVEEAQKSMSSMVDQLASRGIQAYQQSQQPKPQPGQTQQNPPQTQQTPAVQNERDAAGVDLESLGLDPEEPAAKAISAISQQVNTLAQQNQELQQHIQNQQQAQQQQLQQQNETKAEEYLASLNDPMFGKSGERNAIQEMHKDLLYDIANAIAIGAYQNGQPIPPLQRRLALAKMKFDKDMGRATAAPQVGNGAQPQPAQPPQPNQRHALPQNSPGTLVSDDPGPGIAGRWSQDPNIRRQLGL